MKAFAYSSFARIQRANADGNLSISQRYSASLASRSPFSKTTRIVLNSSSFSRSDIIFSHRLNLPERAFLSNPILIATVHVLSPWCDSNKYHECQTLEMRAPPMLAFAHGHAP